MTTTLVLAALSCGAWLYLALGRGGFWLCRQVEQRTDAPVRVLTASGGWPSVTVIIPARNEVELVGTTVGSLLEQRYPGKLNVIVVDDHSEDGTSLAAMDAAVRLRQSERLTVLSAPSLPPGWSGKLWAVAHGIAHAESGPETPDYLLLTDADIRYEHDALARLVAGAAEQGWVLSSLMVKLHCRSFAEWAFIPAFVFFFQMIYPFAWVNRTNRRTAAAAGGCMLVSRRALAEAGGIESIRGRIIDDCALGGLMKRIGPIHLALGETVQSLRACPSVRSIRQMVVRTAFAQLDYSPWQLAGVVPAMLLVFIIPVAVGIAGEGWPRVLALLAWSLMTFLFVPTVRRYGVSVLWAVALPAIALVYLCFTIESAVLYRLGRGGHWKGRSQAHAAELLKAGRP